MNSLLENHFFFYASSDMIYHSHKQKAERYLGGSINEPEVYIVRDVAPNKVLIKPFRSSIKLQVVGFVLCAFIFLDITCERILAFVYT